MTEQFNETQCKHGALVQPFITTTCELLKSEYNIEVTDVTCKDAAQSIETRDISFVTTLNGAMNANLIFSFSKDLAKAVLDNFGFLEYDESTFDEIVMELVSEFLNIVVGRAMKHIKSQKSLIFSPPIEFSGGGRILCGKEHTFCKIDIATVQSDLSIIFSTVNEDEKE